MSIIRDKSLAASGLAKINWVKDFMPVLNHYEKQLAKEQPLKGLNVAVCVHLEAKTAYLGMVLKAAGAEITVHACANLTSLSAALLRQ